MKQPSEKQIEFAKKISKELGDDFPASSDQFTAQAYYLYIKNHIDEYNKEIRDSPIDEDDIMYGFCGNDVWCENY